MGVGEVKESAGVNVGDGVTQAQQLHRQRHPRSHRRSTSHSLSPWTSDLSPQSLSVLLRYHRGPYWSQDDVKIKRHNAGTPLEI